MPKSYLYFLMLLIFTITACFSDEDPLFTSAERSLPAITTEGLNTFGCYIDGELFGPLDSPGFAQDPIDAWHTLSPTFSFQVICTQFDKEISSRKVLDLTAIFESEGTYPLRYQAIFDNDDLEWGGGYFLDTLSSHSIEILRFDAAEAIVSGTFHFTAIAQNYSDTIKVTDGRFDVIVTY